MERGARGGRTATETALRSLRRADLPLAAAVVVDAVMFDADDAAVVEELLGGFVEGGARRDALNQDRRH